MSSSYDAGKWTDLAIETKKSKCQKSENGKHDWIRHFPDCPSRWDECKNCGDKCYYK